MSDNGMYKDLIHSAVDAAKQAAKVLRTFSSDSLKVNWKPDDSPVTEADLAADELITGVLQSTGVPIVSEEHFDLSKDERKGWESFWVVDPLDGTKEFMHGRPQYAVNIGLIHKGKPVLGVIALPEFHRVYAGYVGKGMARFEEGVSEFDSLMMPEHPIDPKLPFTALVSRSHMHPVTTKYLDKLREKHPDLVVEPSGSATKFCRVAEGTAHIYPRHTPCMIWDTAAGDALLNSVGKGIYRFSDGKSLDYLSQQIINPPFLVR